MELEPGNPGFVAVKDERGVLAEPPPVKLLSVADVTVLTPGGHEKFLDSLFLWALQFDPFDPADPRPRIKYETLARAHPDRPRLPGRNLEDGPVRAGPRWYRAENFVLHYAVVEKLLPEHLKLVQVQVPSLEETVQRLLARGISYERVRGLMPGMRHLQVMDPAGHVVQIFEGGEGRL